MAMNIVIADMSVLVVLMLTAGAIIKGESHKMKRDTVWKESSTVKCGRVIETVDKNLDGHYARRGELPWQANLMYNQRSTLYSHMCGGTIINEYWILTAAHCGVGFDLRRIIVLVGDQYQSRADPGEQIFLVDKFIMHESFKKDNLDNDIALLKLRPIFRPGGITFSNTVQPACLPIGDSPPSLGTEFIISGWGVMSVLNNRISDMLKRTIMPLITRDSCESVFTNIIPQSVFCAGHINGDTELCKGDSGGPAVYKKGEMYIVYGVIAASSGCRPPNNPSMFTNITAHLSWIQQTIQRNSHASNQETIPSRPKPIG